MNRPFAARAAIAFVLSCFSMTVSAAPAYQFTAPDKTKDGWQTSSLSDDKIDLDLLRPMFERIASGQYKGVQSVLIVRNGKLAVEEYFPRTEGDRREQAIRRVAPVEMTSAT